MRIPRNAPRSALGFPFIDAVHAERDKGNQQNGKGRELPVYHQRLAELGECMHMLLLVMDGCLRWRKWLRQVPLSPLYHKLCNPSRKLRNHKKLFKNLLTKSVIRGII